MTTKKSSVSRRSLFTTQLGSLVALIVLPQLVSACGTPEAQQDGATPSAGQKTGRKAATSSKSTKKTKVDDDTDTVADADATKNADVTASQNQVATNPPANQTQQPAAQLAPTQPVNSKVSGAKPDGGFFSRGAPALSLAQISAGQQIAAKCEGGLHDLVIEPEHLQALAQGQTVQIKSSTQTHFANPTVHNHTVTYTPIMG